MMISSSALSVPRNNCGSTHSLNTMGMQLQLQGSWGGAGRGGGGGDSAHSQHGGASRDGHGPAAAADQEWTQYAQSMVGGACNAAAAVAAGLVATDSASQFAILRY